MAYEFRFIPPGYEPPRRRDNSVQPQIDVSYRIAKARYVRGMRLWERGTYPGQPSTESGSYDDWVGELMSPEYYRPDWDPETATRIAVYENVSEGTPTGEYFSSEAEALDWMRENWAGSREHHRRTLLSHLTRSVHGTRFPQHFARLVESWPEEAAQRLASMLFEMDERVLQLDSALIAAALAGAGQRNRLEIITTLPLVLSQPSDEGVVQPEARTGLAR